MRTARPAGRPAHQAPAPYPGGPPPVPRRSTWASARRANLSPFTPGCSQSGGGRRVRRLRGVASVADASDQSAGFGPVRKGCSQAGAEGAGQELATLAGRGAMTGFGPSAGWAFDGTTPAKDPAAPGPQLSSEAPPSSFSGRRSTMEHVEPGSGASQEVSGGGLPHPPAGSGWTPPSGSGTPRPAGGWQPPLSGGWAPPAG